MCERCQALEDEITILKQRLTDLNVGPIWFLPGTHIARGPLKILNFLYGQSHPCHRRVLLSAVYDDPYDSPRDERIIDVWLVRLRRTLATINVEVKTEWGVGYYLPDASKAIIKALLCPVDKSAASSGPNSAKNLDQFQLADLEEPKPQGYASSAA